MLYATQLIATQIYLYTSNSMSDYYIYHIFLPLSIETLSTIELRSTNSNFQNITSKFIIIIIAIIYCIR